MAYINGWTDQVMLTYFNSLAPKRWGCKLKLVILILISSIYILSNSCEIAIRWMSLKLTDDSSTLFQLWLGALRQQAITWINVDPYLYHHMTSLGHRVVYTLRSTIYNLLNFIIIYTFQVNQKQYVYFIPVVVGIPFVLCHNLIIICRYCNWSVVSSEYHWILHAQITSSYAINLHIASTTSKGFFSLIEFILNNAETIHINVSMAEVLHYAIDISRVSAKEKSHC